MVLSLLLLHSGDSLAKEGKLQPAEHLQTLGREREIVKVKKDNKPNNDEEDAKSVVGDHV